MKTQNGINIRKQAISITFSKGSKVAQIWQLSTGILVEIHTGGTTYYPKLKKIKAENLKEAFNTIRKYFKM